MCRHAERGRGGGGGRGAGGFTLIELMIAVAILGILLSLAVPAYGEFVKRVRREDGRALLQLNAQRLQRCFTLAGSYVDVDDDGNDGCALRTASEDGHYGLESSRTATTFTIRAVPVAGDAQASDTACATLSYDHTGRKGASGADPTACW